MMRPFRRSVPPTIELTDPAPARAVSRRRRLAAALMVLMAGLFTSYCATVIAVSVGDILLPGNAPHLDSIPVGIPGISELSFDIPVDISIPVPEGVPIIGGQGSGASRPRAEEPINILVMGTDATLDFAPETIPGRTDTIMVVSLDTRLKRATILNFPRDSWLEVSDGRGGWVVDRINTAFPRGILVNGEDGGPQAVIHTIEHNFGISIRHYVLVDWRGFTRIVDALGGVTILVTKDLYDPLSHVLAPFGGRLDAGWHHFTGEEALAYSRYRADSDLERIERQHQVLFALIDRAVSADVLNNPLGLWDSYRDAVTTDINTVEVPGLGLLARQVGDDRIEAFSLGPAARDVVTSGGGQVLVLDPRVAAEIVEEALPAVFKGGLYVQIQNGAQQPGWATRTRDYMVRNGAPRYFLEASDRYTPALQKKTVVLNYTGDPELARRLARSLGIPDDQVIKASIDFGVEVDVEPQADIVIIAGSDLPL